MRVLMATPFYYPTVGGTESIVENLTVHLNRIGISTDIMTLNPNWQPIWKTRVERVRDIKVMRVPALNPLPRRFHHDKMSFMVDYLPANYRAILDSYDVVHFHNDVNLCFPLFSYSIRKPKIFHCHCLNMTYPLYRRNFISRTIFKNTANMYIAVSDWVAFLLKNLDVPMSRIRTVYNGIDTDEFHPSQRAKTSDVILFVGRITAVKGLSVVLRSLYYLRQPTKLVIIGPAYDREYAQTVLALASKIATKTDHSIEFKGIQPREELIRWYQKASILVLPSLSEPFGIVGLEALSCGTPVVASSVGGIPEFVQDENSGILVPPGDPARLAVAIQRLLDDEETRMRLGETGRKLVVEKFSSAVMTRNVLQIYKDMLSC